MLLSALRSIVLCSILCSRCGAQYFQDYIWTRLNANTNVPQWRPDWTSNFQTGVVLSPQVVVLEYNCFYMEEICINASNFFFSGSGRGRRYPNLFGYDLNRSRKAGRRRRSCPTGRYGWASSHPCPEAGAIPQGRPMRQNGPWYYTALDPVLLLQGITNPILNLRVPPFIGNTLEASKIRYSCDEFPPATWIEGGNGFGAPSVGQNLGNSFTRCAAISCGRRGEGIKAEQNWQGTAHGLLRQELIAVARQAVNDGRIPVFSEGDGFIMFRFDITREENNIAARVLTFSDLAGTQLLHNPWVVSQAKRSDQSQDYLQWLNDVSVKELLASSNHTSHHIYANESLRAQELASTHRAKHRAVDLANVPSAENARSSERSSEGSFGDTQGVDTDTSSSLAARFGALLKRGMNSKLSNATSVVEAALVKAAALNAARHASPRRERGTGTSFPSLLNITDEIAEAAAIVTEAIMADTVSNITKRSSQGSYWMAQIARRGTVPWGGDPNYQVFRNVLDYGAKGDGVTDDTLAIKQAMTAGNRCGPRCNGSTTKNAIVYFPPGRYLVSSTIPMPFGTQVIGDASDWPTIVASSVFVGLGVLSADEYTGGGIGPDGLDQEYYINTANFYRQVRNLRIDITQTISDQQIACLHWQVGQATSLQNLELVSAPGTKQQGIFTENGSGGVMSDITFRGGAFGIFGGDQQFTTQRLTFDGCAVGAQVIWDWGWVWKSVTMINVDEGFRLLPQDDTASRKRQTNANATGHVGSAGFMDSTFTNVHTAVLIAPPSSQTGSGSTGIYMENVAFDGVARGVADTDGNVLLVAVPHLDSWILGPAYTPNRTWSDGSSSTGSFARRPELLDAQGRYFERAKPQYEDRDVSEFMHVKDYGAKGDGVADDTAALQQALYAAQGKILFIDAGSYILSDTVTIPTGTKLVGEAWSQLVAFGYRFYDRNHPRPMLRVGSPGEVGDIEMQDLLFTSQGPTVGLIMVEWNMQASAAGAAALWDCHARIGGAVGTQLTPAECPPVGDGNEAWCSAASLIMHITPSASGYFENMWLWVADHMIDDPDLNDANNTLVQTSIFVARGLLIESVSATWLYGTASEHSVLYQYNFNNAKNIFAAIMQTESPYYQPTPKPPAPFADVIGQMPGDPTYACRDEDDFDGCDASWAVIIQGSSNIHIGGAGLYSWFSSYTQDCIDSQTCQKALLLLKDNAAGVRLRNLITIGAKYMAVEDGEGIAALDNLNVDFHPSWSQITAADFEGNGTEIDQEIWISPRIWELDVPQFGCIPPCTVQLPPWTQATSTVNYPLLTVSSGNWTSTITLPPLTITEVLFDLVTLTVSSGTGLHKRQEFMPFWPTPAPIPYFSPATYNGPDGLKTTTTPSDAFPAPPVSIGPNASPPPTGRWPGKAVSPTPGPPSLELYDARCKYDSFRCGDSWEFGEMGPQPPDDWESDDYAPGGPEDQNQYCPDDNFPTPTTTSFSATSSSSTTSSFSTTTKPLEKPAPDDNHVDCNPKNIPLKHKQMDLVIASFCDRLAYIAPPIFKGPFFTRQPELFAPDSRPTAAVLLSIEVIGGCGFNFSHSECTRYLKDPVDGCDCKGVDGKRGGMVSNNCLIWKIDPYRLK